jgi:hypothetical protein
MRLYRQDGMNYNADQILDGKKFPINQAPYVFAGCVHANGVEGVVPEVTYGWHQSPCLVCYLRDDRSRRELWRRTS